MLKEICKTSESISDRFVGLRFSNGLPSVIFPRGFELPSDDKQAKNDIIKLLTTIQKFSGRYEGNTNKYKTGEVYLDFPILSYQYIIYNYLTYGYYTDNETHYSESVRGKIDWKRTIQKEKPQVDSGNVVYLKYITRTNRINENNLITKIHEWCVYESFLKLGWLFLGTNAMPKKPSIRFNKNVFKSIINKELNNTFNTQKLGLFKAMLNVIDYQEIETIDSIFNESFGVERFEKVWENLINYAFGVDNREDYFPHTSWTIVLEDGNKSKQNNPLIPDTIMLKENTSNRVYILDAKYYYYGINNRSDISGLPNSTDIEKQIVYGEYIEKKKSSLSLDDNCEVYNAFIMPFNSLDEKWQTNGEHYKFIGTATADWKGADEQNKLKNYEYVLGILMDTKFLIYNITKRNHSEIGRLAKLIEDSCEKSKALIES